MESSANPVYELTTSIQCKNVRHMGLHSLMRKFDSGLRNIHTTQVPAGASLDQRSVCLQSFYPYPDLSQQEDNISEHV